jgi:2-C-methyl-D-erythritol 4-phosphate cytidylyltransferase
VEIAGRPLLAWSLEAFARADGVHRVVIAAPPSYEGQVEKEAARASAPAEGFEIVVVSGGDTRPESVGRALAVSESELVAVHDAARPLVTRELIEAVLAKLEARPDAAGVIAATPLTDTVKRAREPRPDRGEFERGGPTVAKTESRDHLWAAQTPQAFRTAALREAHDADPQRLAAATDDAMLVEKAGGKVLIELAPARNLKVTTLDDLRLAELLLAERRA